MKKLFELFRPMDEALLRQVDQMLASAGFQQVNDQLNGLDENIRKVINQLIFFGIILLPLFLAFLIFMLNWSTKSEIELKRQIIEEIRSFQDKNRGLRNISQTVMSNSVLADKNALIDKLKAVLSSTGIDLSKIQVGRYSAPRIGNVTKTEATLIFKDIYMDQLGQVLNQLLAREKMKVRFIKVERNKKDTSLSGELEIIHFGRTGNG